MGHDATHALMGATGSSHKEVTNLKGATVIEAGLRVCLKNDGTPSIAKSDGAPIGISLGRDLSDSGRTVVCRKGLKVPVKLASGFNPAIGAQVAISDTTGEAKTYTGSGDSYINAVYGTGRLGGSGATGGVAETATTDSGTVGVALIDFPGGV